jgi:hypothetical protein
VSSLDPVASSINTPVQALSLRYCDGTPVRVTGLKQPLQVSTKRSRKIEGTPVYFNGSSGAAKHGATLVGNNSVLSVSKRVVGGVGLERDWILMLMIMVGVVVIVAMEIHLHLNFHVCPRVGEHPAAQGCPRTELHRGELHCPGRVAERLGPWGPEAEGHRGEGGRVGSWGGVGGRDPPPRHGPEPERGYSTQHHRYVSTQANSRQPNQPNLYQAPNATDSLTSA